MSDLGYDSIANFEKDFQRVVANENDMQLIQYVQRRVNATEPELRKKIVSKLLDQMLETNPMAAFEMIMNEPQNKNKILVIDTKEDPWFRC